MPTYEYACAKCGHTFETSQSILDKPLTVCPKDLCLRKKWGRGKVKRTISAGAGLLFKGSGFYITDYRSEGYKKSAKSDTAAPAATPAAPSTGGDKSPAAPPAAKPAKPKAGKV